jgi:hypothetical protein
MFKQINNTDENKLKIYFRSYYAEQHYSLSGYFHIQTTLTDDELFNHHGIREWLEFNRYHIKLSPSQDEEMIQVGTLCFSSIFTYREDLKHAILQDPLWHPTKENHSPIFDIYPADFQGPDKKTKMLSISAEKSRQSEVAEYFSSIYTGSKKSYPNGTMMAFIPMHEGVKYTDEYRHKLIVNDEAYIGTEEAISIRGLQDLNNTIKLSTGDTVTIRELLKLLPAAPQMSRPQLFQLIEMNNTGTVGRGFQSIHQRIVWNNHWRHTKNKKW